jgi:hypothetical protein
MPDAVQLLNQHFAATQDAWVRIAAALKESVAALSNEAFLRERPATRFILAWMKRLTQFQTEFGKLFGRIKRPPKADDFTAAVALCLEQFLAARGLAGRVASEETTHRARGAKRPDISVFSLSGRLVATVECKTDFGWSRKKWKEKIERRTEQFLVSCPGSDFFLCVMTRRNWDYSVFESSPLCGKRRFCLTAVPLRRISDPAADADMLLPIEPMFLDILARLLGDLAQEIHRLPAEDRQKAVLALQGKGGNT